MECPDFLSHGGIPNSRGRSGQVLTSYVFAGGAIRFYIVFQGDEQAVIVHSAFLGMVGPIWAGRSLFGVLWHMSHLVRGLRL